MQYQSTIYLFLEFIYYIDISYLINTDVFERAAGIHKVNKEKIIKTNKTEKIENRLISLLLKSVMNGFENRMTNHLSANFSNYLLQQGD